MTEKTKNKSKKTVFRKIKGIVGYVLIFLIAALFVFVIRFKTTNRAMFVFGRATVWVLSSSMEPTIPERSYILVRSVSADEVKIGDVIMFRSDDPDLNGANNTHRVIGISDDRTTFTTQGDANQTEDRYPVKAENIIAVYEKNLPVLTAVGRFLFTGIGTVVAVTLVFVIIMIIYLPDIIKATRAKSAELENKHQAQIDELVRAEVERLKRENTEENKEEQTEAGCEPEPEKENENNETSEKEKQ